MPIGLEARHAPERSIYPRKEDRVSGFIKKNLLCGPAYMARRRIISET